MNHFTKKNDVIASAEFTNHAADEVSGGSFQKRAAFEAVVAVDFGEPIRELRCKSAGKMVLICRKDINREVARFGEI